MMMPCGYSGDYVLGLDLRTFAADYRQEESVVFLFYTSEGQMR